MPDFLKGNYGLNHQNQQKRSTDSPKSLTETFEESALAKLGGSICFVSKSGSLIWDGDSAESETK